MPFNPENFVYTVPGCTFSLAGYDYGVSRIRLFAAESGIPTAELTINPKPNAVAADVETLRLEDMLKYISEIQGYANNPKGICNLNFQLTCVNETYTVDIQKWLLVDAGLTTDAKGELACRITMQHPIQAATNSTITLLNTYRSAVDSGLLDGDTVLRNMLVGLDRYIEQHDPSKGGIAVAGGSEDLKSDVVAIDEYIIAKARVAVQVLMDYTEWDYPTAFPFTSVPAFEKVFRGIAVAPDNYIQEGLSPYHTLMSELDELMVMTRGTFSDKPLSVAPREPWAASTLKFKESEIASISLPQAPVNLISGVTVTGAPDTDVPASTLEDGPSSNIAVRGGYIAKAKSINGKIYIVNPPGFFTYFGQVDNGTLVLNERGLANNDTAMTTGGEDAAIDIAKLKFTQNIRTAADAWAHDCFWKIYRSNFGVSFRTKFTLDQGSIPVQPGRVCDLVTDAGQTMYTCYITSVNHVLDIAGKEAYTDIMGYYARGSTGIVDVLKVGEVEKSWIFGGNDASVSG